jgi:integrase
MPSELKCLTEFLYLTGWRKGEARKLEWRDVDLVGKVVRLRIENSKTKTARVLPLTGRLWDIIETQSRQPQAGCPYVFHRDGKQVGDFRKVWKRACQESGLKGFLVHDFRRCAESLSCRYRERSSNENHRP